MKVVVIVVVAVVVVVVVVAAAINLGVAPLEEAGVGVGDIARKELCLRQIWNYFFKRLSILLSCVLICFSIIGKRCNKEPEQHFKDPFRKCWWKVGEGHNSCLP